MKKMSLVLATIAVTFLLQSYTTPGRAATLLTWVSATGSDGNTATNCQQTAPCQTFVAALGVTLQGGTINCIGPVAYIVPFTPVTVLQAVTIDCHGTAGGFDANQANGFVINAPGAVVTLRGLSIDGIYGYNGTSSAGYTGVVIQAAAVVNIEDCEIENLAQRGINDLRTGGGTQLFVKNTVVRNNIGTGIALAAAAKNSVVLDNVKSVGNAYGVAAASGNIVFVSRSVMSENSIAGIFADSGANVMVDNSVISHNQTAGVQANGTVVLGNSDISFNTSSISGPTTSYGNNRIYGNGAGTTPTIAAQQ
jgi:hypothetical protein